MSPDLEAIDLLSKRFEAGVDKLPTSSLSETFGHFVTLYNNDPLFAQGTKIWKMYEAEKSKYPNDTDVLVSFSRHLYRVGWMHYKAYAPGLLPNILQKNKERWNIFKQNASDNIVHANHCCHCMFYSFQTSPNSRAAMILAELFRAADFRRTSFYWLQHAETTAMNANNAHEALEAKADQLDMHADGNIVDPPLSNNVLFPTTNTMGLFK